MCQFGAERAQLADPLGVTAAMAHEVAHAFRRVHALEVDDTEVEERLTDLTTVLLGFGLLTTNASSRHRSSGGIGVHHWSHQTLGYLPPQAMSFRLAIQACARAPASGLRRHLARQLEPNQAGFFERACKCIERELPDLHTRLGITADLTWPDAPDLRFLLAPLDDDDDDGPAPPAPVRRGVNHGRAVFRIERRRTRRYAGLTALIAFVATPILGALLHIPVLMIAIAVAAIVTAGVLGHRVRADHCADPECKALLAPGLTHCPGCEGTLLGTIAHPDLRLEAAEALARRGIRP